MQWAIRLADRQACKGQGVLQPRAQIGTLPFADLNQYRPLLFSPILRFDWSQGRSQRPQLRVRETLHQQNLEAWLADLVGWGWQERKGLRNGSAADPGLQETLSKQADAKAVGQPPTSGGCRDNILPTNPQPATTAMRATDHRHQQTLSHGLIDRCLYGLARHFGGRPPQGLSGRGRPKLL